jgi:hypothetical protein
VIQVTAPNRFPVPGSNPLQKGRHHLVACGFWVVVEGSMKINLLLQILGMGTLVLGVFSTSWFGRLDWASVPSRFRWAVGASQFSFMVAGILLGVSSCRF